MRIQLRVRTNDVSEASRFFQMVNDGFVLYDNCSEVKFGKSKTVSKETFSIDTLQPKTIKEARNFKTINTLVHPETREPFNEIIFMVRDVVATETRLEKENEIEKGIDLRILQEKGVPVPNRIKKENKESPYHYNVIEWKDRVTNKRYRLVFDTVVFLTDDEGNTIRKIEG